MAKLKSSYEESITLRAGHAMILGHLPNKIDLSKVGEKLSVNKSQDIESFGLFDSSSPNYTTYYPDVTEEDLKPKDSEFINPVFRMLSNTVVQHRYNPIEFPADVLKKSMYKLIGQTVNIDHETATGNAIGTISAVEWQSSYKVGDLEVPAGINATLKIDGKSNPRIARGIMMEPPSIHSNSVTVAFVWKPSHPELEVNEFFDKLGTFDKEGKLIRKVATEIKFYRETSLVGLGADPFAQRVKDGKIVNPGLAESREPISKENLSFKDGENNQVITFDWKDFPEIVKNNFDDTNLDNINNTDEDMDIKAILKLIETSLALPADTLTEENYIAKLAELNTNLASLTQEVQTLKNTEVEVEGLKGITAITTAVKELNQLKAKLGEKSLDDVIAMGTFGETALTELRAETTRLYKVSVGEGKEDAAILSVINTAEATTLKALKTQYSQLSEDKFQSTCQDCGSHNVVRASADPTKEHETFTEKSTDEVIEKFTSVGKVKLFGTE